MLDETFAVEDGLLVRRVRPRRGTPYEHTCTKEVFDEVAWAIEELGAAPFNLEALRARLDAPWTQVAVALAFLKERGFVEPARKRMSRAVESYSNLDALIEYHALRERAPGSAQG